MFMKTQLLRGWDRRAGGRGFDLPCAAPGAGALFRPLSVSASQLDRLNGMIGMDAVELGVIPLTAPVKLGPVNGSVMASRARVRDTAHHEQA
ncbi:hypothetical protein ACIQVT_05100 [Streptomyces sp. NPDC100445]|uniref:hypothetical protein n=1 Tax=Streptomyces sp. NPDC100445 TaxID=3366102 RepID=UPI0037F8C347